MAAKKRKKAKKQKKQNNLAILADKGVIELKRLLPREKRVIQALKPDEIKTLIKVARLVGGRNGIIPFLFF